MAKLCPTLCDPMDCVPPGSSVHGISQARILERVAIFFSRRSSWPRDRNHISCIAGRFFTVEPPGKPFYKALGYISSWPQSQEIMLQKQVCAFREICSDHYFKGKLETTIQIFCATKLEISVYLWNEIIQEVIELLIQKAFSIWPRVGLGLYLLFFRIRGRPDGKEANGPKFIGNSTIFQWLGVNFF